MSEAADARHDVEDIRRELWRTYAGLRWGELEPELAETMVSTLDSLIDAARLEGELRTAEDELASKKARSWRRLG